MTRKSLCQLAGSALRERRAAAYEIKFDGYRIQLRVEAGKVSLKTRKGLDWTVKCGAIAEAAGDLPDGIIDGEIVALDANGAPDFAGLQAALSESRTEELIFFAFDLLHDGAEDLRKRPLSERKDRLQNLLANCGDDGPIRFVEHFETGGDAVLRSACRLSLEGIVSKKLMHPTNQDAPMLGKKPSVGQDMKWSLEAGPRLADAFAPCSSASTAAIPLSIKTKGTWDPQPPL